MQECVEAFIILFFERVDVLTGKHILILQCSISLHFFSHVPIFAKGLYGTRSTAVLSLSYDG
jgi:hypothetical protein